MQKKTLVEYVPMDPTAVACRPRPGDVRKDPARCVIHNHIMETYPWARLVKVGVKTITMYDYRCPHNPEGKVGVCLDCPRKRIVWATPLTAAKAIKEFDKGGEPEFPAIKLREEEAIIETGMPWERGRDDVVRRRQQRDYVNAKRKDPNHLAVEKERRTKRKAARRAS